MRPKAWADRDFLVMLRQKAAEHGVEPICLYCDNFRGDYCGLVEETQSPYGVCRHWTPVLEALTG